MSTPKSTEKPPAWPGGREPNWPDSKRVEGESEESSKDTAALQQESKPLWMGPDFTPDVAISLGSAIISARRKSGQKGVDISGYVATEMNTGRVVAVGEAARNLDGRAPADVRVVRPVRNGAIVDFELARKLLGDVMKQIKGKGIFGTRLLLAVASELSPMERQAAVQGARAAGARQIRLVEQPLVAALGAGVPILRAPATMVIDLGAGNCQVGVISMGSLVSSRVLRSAGDRMDEEIRTHIRRTRHVLLADHTAETLKRELGRAILTEGENAEQGVAGCDLGSGLPSRLTVKASEVHEAILPVLESIAEHVKETLTALPARVLSDVVRQGAVLTGGMAQLPELAAYLERETNLPIRLAENPQSCVAAGLDVLLRERNTRRAVLVTEDSGPRRKSRDSGRTLALVLLLASLLLTLAYSVQIRKERPTPVDSAMSSGLSLLWGLTSRPQDDFNSGVVRAQLAERDSRVAALVRENHALRGLSHLHVSRSAENPGIAARVLSRDPRGWLSYLVLDRGTDNGVHSGMVVLSGEGVVGEITYSDATTSRVRLLTDARSVLPGAVKGRKSGGIVYGQGTRALSMRYLDPDAKIRPGDKVVTSAQGGIFPAGLMIGRVSSLTPPQHDVSASAVVEPSVSFDELTDVLILKPSATRTSLPKP